jgi:hypothetical protein
MQTVKTQESRKSIRFQQTGSVIVKAKINDNEFWKEKGSLKSVSRLGAGFEIQKPCKVGQVISLLIPMPINLRLYDHDKQLYRVWGLVQHCHSVTSENFTGYNVGVAFIGKDAPNSFYEKPDQSYRILGLNEDGLWKIIEAEREFINRRHPRYWIACDAIITETNLENETIRLNAVTENISKSGAAVFCESEAVVGDMVKFSCPDYNFETDAIVRNRLGVGNTTPKIHLEFLENEFPINKLKFEIES